jgi:hypothetical protein
VPTAREITKIAKKWNTKDTNYNWTEYHENVVQEASKGGVLGLAI